MERKEAFKRWLQNEKSRRSGRPISEQVIKGYARELHRLSDIMYEKGVITKRLYSMNTYEEVKQAIKKIKEDETYEDINRTHKNNVHKALNYYERFIEEISIAKEE